MKIGDKVKMTRRGFRFYSDLDNAFELSSVSSKMNSEDFNRCVCELFAVNGVGTIKRFNEQGDPYIRWEFSLNGMYYFHEHYYEEKDIRKLTWIERIYHVIF